MTSTEDQAYADALVSQTGWLRDLVRRLIEDRDAADDVCQSTLLRAWRHRPSTDGGLRPWLATVARRIWIRERKREASRPVREAQAAQSEAQPPASDVVERMAWQQRVVAAVMRLEEPYRTTLLMRFWESKPPRAVASHFGVPVETVRTRIKRGLAKVRAELDQECGGRQAWVTAILPLAELSAFGVACTSIATVVMTKKLTLAVGGAIAALAFFALSSTFDPGDPIQAESDDPVVAASSTNDESDVAPEAASERVVVTTESRGTPRFEEDPAFEAAMCGFTGRVVFEGMPVPTTGVRLYRIAMHSLIDQLDRRTGSTKSPLEYLDTETDTDGVFHIERVWPRGMFVLHYGRGSENPAYRILEAAPGPAELVDLGDLKLVRTARITGRVVDEDGEPISNAEVFGGDFPGAAMAAVPLDRLTADTVIVNRRPGLAPVVELPSWAHDFYDNLPIGRTRTDANGRFSLTGLAAGSHVLIARKESLLPVVEPRVRLQAGQIRDLGDLTLTSGEELWGRVVDTKGDPVLGAEVVAAPTSVVPIDLGQRLTSTDQNGEFSATGFPRGRATVAVRRGPGEPWTVAEPRPVDSDIEIVLPETHTLTVRVTDTAGGAVAPTLEMLCGETRSTTTMAQFGIDQGIDLSDRCTTEDSIAHTVSDIPAGDYVLVVRAEGHATRHEAVSLTEDTELSIELDASPPFRVYVRSANGPVRNASILVGIHPDHAPPTNVPDHCGYTDEAGTLVLPSVAAPRIVVTAVHPAFGIVDAIAERDDERIDLEMLSPGAVHGTFVPDERADPASRWAIALRRDRDGPLGMLDGTPQFAQVTPDGRFQFLGLQPGKYWLQPVPTLGEQVTLAQVIEKGSEWFEPRGAGKLVTVQAGSIADVRLGQTPGSRSGNGRVHGHLLINGLPVEGYRVDLFGPDVFENTKTDAHGAFVFENKPFGEYHVSFTSHPDQVHIWSESLVLDDTARGELRVEIAGARIAGRVVDENGTPVANAEVSVLGMPDASFHSISTSLRTDANGNFDHDELVPGKYALRAGAGHGDRSSGHVRLGGNSLYSKVTRVETQLTSPALNIELVVRRAATISGRIDLASLGLEPGTELLLKLNRIERPSPASRWEMHGPSEKVNKDLTFEFTNLAPTEYRLILVREDGEEIADKRVDVTNGSIEDRAFSSFDDWTDEPPR